MCYESSPYDYIIFQIFCHMIALCEKHIEMYASFAEKLSAMAFKFYMWY